MTKEVKKHYLLLKQENSLSEVMPNSTGEWEKDKKKFTKLYNETIKFVLDFERSVNND